MFEGIKIHLKYIFLPQKSQNFDFQKLCGTSPLLLIHPLKNCEMQFFIFSLIFSINYGPPNNNLYVSSTYLTNNTIILALFWSLIFGGTLKICIFHHFSAF